jgi:peptide/nickel transport system substrate-binding protein
MNIKSKYLIPIALIFIIATSAGAYVYYQNIHAEELKLERQKRWEDWSRTLYIGTTDSYPFHPGINVGRGNTPNSINAYARGGKLLWIDAKDVSKFNPSIAESWSFKTNPEGENYIEYKIKKGLKFQDGTEITSEAVKYSWEQEYIEMPARTKNKEIYHLYTHQVSWTRLETPDNYTLLQFIPKETGKFLPIIFSFLFALPHGFVVSPTSTEKYAKEANNIEDFVNQAGFGPFILKEYIPNERFVLVPWKDYPENPEGGYAGPTKVTKLDKVVVIIYADATTMRMALEKGEIDIAALKLNRPDIVDIQKNPDMTVDIAPELGWTQILQMNYHPEFAPLNDTRVRRAILYAIDANEIVDKVTFGTAQVANTPVHTYQPYFFPKPLEDIRKLPMDERIQKAKTLLAEAGYPNGFSTEIFFSTPENGGIATIIQAQLKKVGINLQLKQLESGLYNEMTITGKCPMFFSGWSTDYNDPDSELWYLLRHEHQYWDNGYISSEMDALLEKGRTLYNPSGDPPEREVVYKQIQQEIVDDGINISLYYDSVWQAKRNWVKGFEPWLTTARIYMGIWNAYKVIPSGWETKEPPR